MNNFYVREKKRPSVGTLNDTEKCPYCSRGFVDFMDVGLSLDLGENVILGCYFCGGIFISPDTRKSELNGKLEMLKKQQSIKLPSERVEPGTEQYAKCGQLIPEGKSVKAHERSCKACKGA